MRQRVLQSYFFIIFLRKYNYFTSSYIMQWNLYKDIKQRNSKLSVNVDKEYRNVVTCGVFCFVLVEAMCCSRILCLRLSCYLLTAC